MPVPSSRSFDTSLGPSAGRKSVEAPDPAANRTRPDVGLLDIEMPGLDGISAAGEPPSLYLRSLE
jgi:CheY-like chemotaxis protein